MISYIQRQLKASADAALQAAEHQAAPIQDAARMIITCIENGGKVLVCGNGGSAADSQHIAAELVGRFLINRQALPAVALTTDTSVLTAVANDFGYETVFSRQVEALGKPGDVLLGISTSGTSDNVVRAARLARTKGMKVIALAGSKFTDFCADADVAIRVSNPDTPRIQEVHITVGHIICDLVEKHISGVNKTEQTGV